MSSFFFLGPKGPSLISVHSDNRRIHGLEKKVVRLEDKVTVLETAMAGLARRILDVGQNTGLNYRRVFFHFLHILIPFFNLSEGFMLSSNCLLIFFGSYFFVYWDILGERIYKKQIFSASKFLSTCQEPSHAKCITSHHCMQDKMHH